MTEPIPNRSSAPDPDPTWSEIVLGQFWKRPIAARAAYGVLVLWFIAVMAPALASNKPFIWRVGDGPIELPWLMSLFDRTFFENSVDLFFNTLLFPGCLILVPVWWVWRRAAALPRDRRIPRRRAALLVGVSLWALSLGAVTVFPSQSAKQVYPEMEAAARAQGQEVLAIYPPIPYSYRDGGLGRSLEPASAAHWLGTDPSGRDVLTRLIYGTRVSLTVGLFSVMLYISVGIVVGAVAGYFGGWVDLTIQRVIEVVICIPSLFLVLSVASFIVERSIFHILFLIAAVSWTGPARLVRAEFLKLRELDFVAAARAAGFSQSTIIFREILPNALGPVLVSATFGVASAILVESTMSFLGLGDITLPSWGHLLNTGRTTGVWLMILAPGFAIFTTVSVLNLVGEGVRDALDPKLRK